MEKEKEGDTCDGLVLYETLQFVCITALIWTAWRTPAMDTAASFTKLGKLWLKHIYYPFTLFRLATESLIATHWKLAGRSFLASLLAFISY